MTKRTIKKRRFIPNPRPGFAGYNIADKTLAELAAKATGQPEETPSYLEPKSKRQTIPVSEGVSVDTLGASVTSEPYAPPSALLIGSTLAEDLEGLTPRQRKWWKAAAGAHAKAGRHRINDTHKAAFLAALVKFPDIAGAASESGFSVRAWDYLRARDQEFRQAVEDALRAGLPVIERAMSIRGFQGTLEPIVQNGIVVAHKRVYSDRAMELRARKLDPEGYSEKLMVSKTVNGTVHHVHHLSPALEAMFTGIAGDRGEGSPVIEHEADFVALPNPTSVGLVDAIVGSKQPQQVVDNGTAPLPEDEQTTNNVDRSRD